VGTFNVTIEVAAGPDGPFEPIDAMVDTGATFTVVPASILRRLGVEVTRQVGFVLADGTRIERDAGWMVVRVDGEESPSPVVFGEDDAPVLLGAVTLEVLLLGVDPVNERLVPVDGLMLGLEPEVWS
jgi:predicted aspartyl protease